MTLQTVIGYNNILNDEDVTVVASSTKALTYVENIYDYESYDYWESDEMAYPTITISGTDMAANYVAGVYHNAGGVDINVYKDSVLITTYSVVDSSPFMFLLVDSPDDAALVGDEYVIEFETLEDVRVSLLNIGELLLMQRPCKYVGHNPITLSKTAQITPVKAMKGQTLGGRIIYTGASNSYEVENLQPDWIREDFEPFIEHAILHPYFIAWRILDYPLEVGFGWTSEVIKPQNQRSNGMMSVSWQFEGVVDSGIEQIGDYETS